MLLLLLLLAAASVPQDFHHPFSTLTTLSDAALLMCAVYCCCCRCCSVAHCTLISQLKSSADSPHRRRPHSRPSDDTRRRQPFTDDNKPRQLTAITATTVNVLGGQVSCVPCHNRAMLHYSNACSQLPILLSAVCVLYRFLHLVQHIIRHPIHQSTPPSAANQSLHLPPPIPTRVSSADSALPMLTMVTPLDGRSSSSTHSSNSATSSSSSASSAGSSFDSPITLFHRRSCELCLPTLLLQLFPDGAVVERLTWDAEMRKQLRARNFKLALSKAQSGPAAREKADVLKYRQLHLSKEQQRLNLHSWQLIVDSASAKLAELNCICANCNRYMRLALDIRQPTGRRRGCDALLEQHSSQTEGRESVCHTYHSIVHGDAEHTATKSNTSFSKRLG